MYVVRSYNGNFYQEINYDFFLLTTFVLCRFWSFKHVSSSYTHKHTHTTQNTLYTCWVHLYLKETPKKKSNLSNPGLIYFSHHSQNRSFCATKWRRLTKSAPRIRALNNLELISYLKFIFWSQKIMNGFSQKSQNVQFDTMKMFTKHSNDPRDRTIQELVTLVQAHQNHKVLPLEREMAIENYNRNEIMRSYNACWYVYLCKAAPHSKW